MLVAGSVLASGPSTEEELEQVARLLEHSHVEILHYDHTDDAPLELGSVELLKRVSGLPVEVHLVSADPYACLPQLERAGVEYCAVQLEAAREIDPSALRRFPGQLGLAVLTRTGESVLEELLPAFDYVLFMTTTPGRSGGDFDAAVFDRIRRFRLRHPQMPVHVDGGVHAGVSSALKVLGVDVIVSGSFLYRGESVLQQKLDLVRSDPSLGVEFLMMADGRAPLIDSDAPVSRVIEIITRGRVGAAMVLDGAGTLDGLITDGDFRKAFLVHGAQVARMRAREIMNPRPFSVSRETSVGELIAALERSRQPMLVIPVTEPGSRRYAGCISLHNLLRLL